jgi:hypothetical protein
MLGSVFSILGAGSMFFLAYKAMTIGADVAEMKDLLKDLRRGSLHPELGSHSFPTPLDIDDAPMPNASGKEFVLPPPISRRLDAERGIRRDADEDLSYGVRSSERQH